ncbi:CARDB domain-containing protein [Hymenobacter rubripertinctus]|uniref:CARDB domain-containing protein n=1 Tax=Hymenobacter rubripertinctus TaxID=2029981 RepID=A0A418QLI7_9BACT|nr:CARDB domain-containing protein [Hymenobacter rubripertinctus]RIY06097.1 hypothetical protein D0T11_19360 [Hymenobacter rubripertinctus]
MTHTSPFGRRVSRYRRSHRYLLAAGLALGAGPVLGQQLSYYAGNVQNLAATYQDLTTTGTVITTANLDDANSAPQAIGFNFAFAGTATPFTTFVLNTNGFLRLGSGAPSSPALVLDYAQNTTVPSGPLTSTDARDSNILAPFATDLQAATGGGTEYRVATTGTAPNRVCTIQWKNVRDKPRAVSASNATLLGTQYESFSFQVKLYETSGQIDFVYGPGTAGSGPDAFRAVAVGIKGPGQPSGTLLMPNKASTTPWASALFYTRAVPVAVPFNVRSGVLPDPGRTYRFRASAAQDAAVRAVYTLGQLPGGTAHVVRANIYNAGTQALFNWPVQLSVSGANTFSASQLIDGLPAGRDTTLSFTAYVAAPAPGTNTITVTVPADAFPHSDRATETQTLTAGTLSYFPPLAGSGLTPSFYGFDTRAGITAVKYPNARATVLTAVTDFVPMASNSTGQVIYGVALTPGGTLLGFTPDYVVKAADLGTVVTLPFTTPVPLAAADFLVGIAQRASTVAHYPVGLLGEDPVRTGAFYDRGDLLKGAFADVAPRDFGIFGIGAVLAAPVTSTAAAAPAAGFFLAPNPTAAATWLTFAAPLPTAQPVLVLDALGRAVRQQVAPARASRLLLEVAGLPAGLYRVRVGTATGQLAIY